MLVFCVCCVLANALVCCPGWAALGNKPPEDVDCEEGLVNKKPLDEAWFEGALGNSPPDCVGCEEALGNRPPDCAGCETPKVFCAGCVVPPNELPKALCAGCEVAPNAVPNALVEGCDAVDLPRLLNMPPEVPGKSVELERLVELVAFEGALNVLDRSRFASARSTTITPYSPPALLEIPIVTVPVVVWGKFWPR